jgi:hypothetical protein
VSQHLAILWAQDIVATRPKGNTIFYSLVDPRIVQACDIFHEVLADRMKDSQAFASQFPRVRPLRASTPPPDRKPPDSYARSSAAPRMAGGTVAPTEAGAHPPVITRSLPSTHPPGIPRQVSTAQGTASLSPASLPLTARQKCQITARDRAHEPLTEDQRPANVGSVAT